MRWRGRVLLFLDEILIIGSGKMKLVTTALKVNEEELKTGGSIAGEKEAKLSNLVS